MEGTPHVKAKQSRRERNQFEQTVLLLKGTGCYAEVTR
jgi:hypothetical protein